MVEKSLQTQPRNGTFNLELNQRLMLLLTSLLLIGWVLNPLVYMYDIGNATTFGYNSVQEIHQLGDAIV